MSFTQGRIEFLVNELQQRTEQLAISQEHVAKLQDQLRTATAPKTSIEKLASMSVENQLSAIDETINGRTASYEALLGTSDHKLAADIEAIKHSIGTAFTRRSGTDSLTEELEEMIDRGIRAALKPGGALYRGQNS